MLAAPPKSGKTLLALYWTARMGLPTLYFSADTDPMTMATRAAAMRFGVTQDVARELVAKADPETVAGLKDLDNIRWVFETDPTYQDLELETAAYFEVYGDWPEVIVVDNLMNLVGMSENEWGSMRDSTKALHRLTRITGASVFVCHHMSEGSGDVRMPSPRKMIQGKVSQVPEMILSLALVPELSLIHI